MAPRQTHKPKPTEAAAWWKVVRDVLITALGMCMLLYETLKGSGADPAIVGAGLTLLGLPIALRADERRK